MGFSNYLLNGKHQIKVDKAVMLKGLQLQLSNQHFA